MTQAATRALLAALVIISGLVLRCQCQGAAPVSAGNPIPPPSPPQQVQLNLPNGTLNGSAPAANVSISVSGSIRMPNGYGLKRSNKPPGELGTATDGGRGQGEEAQQAGADLGSAQVNGGGRVEVRVVAWVVSVPVNVLPDPGPASNVFAPILGACTEGTLASLTTRELPSDAAIQANGVQLLNATCTDTTATLDGPGEPGVPAAPPAPNTKPTIRRRLTQIDSPPDTAPGTPPDGIDDDSTPPDGIDDDGTNMDDNGNPKMDGPPSNSTDQTDDPCLLASRRLWISFAISANRSIENATFAIKDAVESWVDKSERQDVCYPVLEDIEVEARVEVKYYLAVSSTAASDAASICNSVAGQTTSAVSGLLGSSLPPGSLAVQGSPGCSLTPVQSDAAPDTLVGPSASLGSSPSPSGGGGSGGGGGSTAATIIAAVVASVGGVAVLGGMTLGYMAYKKRRTDTGAQAVAPPDLNKPLEGTTPDGAAGPGGGVGGGDVEAANPDPWRLAMRDAEAQRLNQAYKAIQMAALMSANSSSMSATGYGVVSSMPPAARKSSTSWNSSSTGLTGTTGTISTAASGCMSGVPSSNLPAPLMLGGPVSADGTGVVRIGSNSPEAIETPAGAAAPAAVTGAPSVRRTSPVPAVAPITPAPVAAVVAAPIPATAVMAGPAAVMGMKPVLDAAASPVEVLSEDVEEDENGGLPARTVTITTEGPQLQTKGAAKPRRGAGHLAAGVAARPTEAAKPAAVLDLGALGAAPGPRLNKRALDESSTEAQTPPTDAAAILQAAFAAAGAPRSTTPVSGASATLAGAGSGSRDLGLGGKDGSPTGSFSNNNVRGSPYPISGAAAAFAGVGVYTMSRAASGEEGSTRGSGGDSRFLNNAASAGGHALPQGMGQLPAAAMGAAYPTHAGAPVHALTPGVTASPCSPFFADASSPSPAMPGAQPMHSDPRSGLEQAVGFSAARTSTGSHSASLPSGALRHSSAESTAVQYSSLAAAGQQISLAAWPQQQQQQVWAAQAGHNQVLQQQRPAAHHHMQQASPDHFPLQAGMGAAAQAYPYHEQRSQQQQQQSPMAGVPAQLQSYTATPSPPQQYYSQQSLVPGDYSSKQAAAQARRTSASSANDQAAYPHGSGAMPSAALSAGPYVATAGGMVQGAYQSPSPEVGMSQQAGSGIWAHSSANSPDVYSSGVPGGTLPQHGQHVSTAVPAVQSSHVDPQDALQMYTQWAEEGEDEVPWGSHLKQGDAAAGNNPAVMHLSSGNIETSHMGSGSNWTAPDPVQVQPQPQQGLLADQAGTGTWPGAAASTFTAPAPAVKQQHLQQQQPVLAVIASPTTQKPAPALALTPLARPAAGAGHLAEADEVAAMLAAAGALDEDQLGQEVADWLMSEEMQ